MLTLHTESALATQRSLAQVLVSHPADSLVMASVSRAILLDSDPVTTPQLPVHRRFGTRLDEGAGGVMAARFYPSRARPQRYRANVKVVIARLLRETEISRRCDCFMTRRHRPDIGTYLWRPGWNSGNQGCFGSVHDIHNNCTLLGKEIMIIQFY